MKNTRLASFRFFYYKKNRLCQRACGLGFRVAREPSLVFSKKKKKPLMATLLRKGDRTKNQIFGKKFSFPKAEAPFSRRKSETRTSLRECYGLGKSW